MFERLVTVRLGRFMERSGVLPTTQFAYLKVWVPVIHFYVSRILQNALETVHTFKIVQIDISAAIAMVYLPLILYKLRSLCWYC